MQCPVDNENLQMSDRQGIEIDYCPKCRGVWLDRGELDKLIERSESEYSPNRENRGNYEEKNQYQSKPRRKEGFMSNIFDGFGGDD